MTTLYEWYAYLSPSSPAHAVGLGHGEYTSYYDVYARVVGVSGAVEWSHTWEPLHPGATAPNVFPGHGPVGAGQVVAAGYDWVDSWGAAPTLWSPNDPSAVAVARFENAGVLYLTARVDGVALPGRLVMAVAAEYDGATYVPLDLFFEDTDPGPDTPPEFWGQHRNTYEIP